MAMDGCIGQFRQKVIGCCKAHRSENQSYKVMNIEEADIHTGNPFGHPIDCITAHDIGESGPDQGSHGIPERDIHFFVFSICDGHEDINRYTEPSDDK